MDYHRIYQHSKTHLINEPGPGSLYQIMSMAQLNNGIVS